MWLAYANIWNQLVYGIATIYVARQLNPSAFAPIAIVLSTIPIAVTIADWGTNSIYTRELSAGRLDKQLWFSLLRRQIKVAATISVLTFLILSLMVPLTLAALTSLAVISLQYFQSSQVLLRSTDQFLVTARLIAISRLPMLLLPIVAQWAQEWLPQVFIGAIAIGHMQAGLVLHHKSKALRTITTGAQSTKYPSHWNQSGRAGWIPILTQLRGLDISIWNSIAGTMITGNYGAVVKWGQPTEILSQSAVAVEYVRWSKTTKVRELFRISSAVKLQLGLSLIASAVLAIFGDVLASRLLGDDYSYAGKMLQMVGIASTLSTITTFLLYCLLALQAEGLVAKVTAISVLIQLVSLIILATAFKSTLAGPIAYSISLIVAIGFFSRTLFVLSQSQETNFLNSDNNPEFGVRPQQ